MLSKQQNRRKEKYLSAADPIPVEVLFEGAEDFLKKIDFLVYPDYQFIETKLIPHFENSLHILKKSISDHRDELKKARNTAQNSIKLTQNCLSFDENFLNKEIVRKLKILTPKNEELRRTTIFTRISFLEQRIETLLNLEKLVQFLVKSPRYYFLNLKLTTRKLYNIAFEMLPALFFENTAIENYVTSLKKQLQLIPKPFSNKQENIEFIRHIISLGIALRDPETKVVPHTEEFDIFRRFLETDESPINITQITELDPRELISVVKAMCMTLMEFCGFEPDDNTTEEILSLLLIRFLFDQNEETDLLTMYNGGSEQLLLKLANLQETSMKDLGFKAPQIPDDFLTKNAKELFDENPILKSLPDNLMTCHFLVNPIDIFLMVKKIDISLTALIAEGRQEELQKSRKFDDLYISWKALFVAASIPYMDIIFERISKWRSLPVIAESYKSICKIPKLVLKGLITEALC
ncbi:hypothetical protein TRFO_24066 [Tritrichomonas foetus]|uniref:Uncharacterized protein n=1 Tax=Tritrichomonas foetus TaxID=1144522 RepID=A0A1J4K9N2_9EUKA|nr:hypothetical protein TRFO_24066 [Tritrichomonas foetus]|eukprot:OHT07658.1 hypothetical protein TRFO_24066 [Tritrichomonas foetus]